MKSWLLENLPAINASFNGIAGCFVIAGFVAVKSGRPDIHRRCMVAALSSSALFLVGYLTRMGLAGGATRFEGPPLVRTFYLVVLFSHTILAMVTVPLVLRAVFLAVKERLAEHRRIVRWAFPIWLYVSVTGVFVYFMLYHVSTASH